MRPAHAPLAVALLAFAASAPAAEDGEPLFNGKDFTGWVIDGPKETTDKATGKSTPVWTVKDGMIHCTGKAFGFLRYDKKFSDFAFHVEYKMEPGPAGKPSGVNSGIGVRTTVVKYTRSGSSVRNAPDVPPSIDVAVRRTTSLPSSPRQATACSDFTDDR